MASQIALYYSGAKELDAIQRDSFKSLGGFISGSPIPKDTLEAIFDEVSELAKQQGKEEIRAVFIKNVGTLDITDLKFYFTIPVGNLATYKVAFILPNSSGQIEEVENSSSFPVFSTFVDANGIGQQQTIVGAPNDLKIGESVGMWIKRIIAKQSVVACSVVSASPDTIETLDLQFDWTDV